MCKITKICELCSTLHGDFNTHAECLNCSKNHKPSDKNCQQNKREEVALYKSSAEHFIVEYAKKCLNKTKSYTQAAKTVVANPAKGRRPTESVQPPEVAILPPESNAMPSFNGTGNVVT